MSVFSALRGVNRFGLIHKLIKSNGVSMGRTGGLGVGVSPFHHGEFPMRPSVFQWRKFKDFLHFYTMLGLIPLTLITTYINVTVGPAELTEIPDGYEPKHWEYYKSPISRIFAKYVIRDKRQDYEGMVCYLNEEAEKVILKQIEKMVRDVMSLRNDYKSWYYRPIDAYHLRFEREEWKYYRDHLAGHNADVTQDNYFTDGGDPR